MDVHMSFSKEAFGDAFQKRHEGRTIPVTVDSPEGKKTIGQATVHFDAEGMYFEGKIDDEKYSKQLGKNPRWRS